MDIKEAVAILGYQLNMKGTDVYTPINYEALETILAELEKKDKRLNRQFKMLQKRDREIEELKKDNSYQWEERCKLTFELEEKDNLINTMQAEFERLEDLEDNTDMLKMELEKKDEIILEMAKFINCFDIDELICKTVIKNTDCQGFECPEKCEQCVIDFFKKKVEE